jgi:NADH:ubiquinone oxidoreductase subunit E
MTVEIARVDDPAVVEVILDRYGRDPGFLIPMLQDLQTELGYLPAQTLRTVSRILEIPLSQCYAVATFYTSLSLQPRGRHIITLCQGTVCYLKGAKEISESIRQQLQVKAGGTTPDGLFTFQPVNCLGACALAPVLLIDDKYYDKVKLRQVPGILADYRKRREAEADAG